ncbi:MAG TPA: hypothetical protein V6C96_05620 [Vampirovibrionales bacterium]
MLALKGSKEWKVINVGENFFRGKQTIMIKKQGVKLFFAGLMSLSMFSYLPAFSAGGVTGYTGNVSTDNAGVAKGNGNTAAANIRLEFNVARFVAIGVYDTAGSINHPIFSNPSANFPGGSAFAADGTALLSAESDLSSKFDLDGVLNLADQQTIVDAMNATSDTASQEIIIKGAVFTNLPGATAVSVGLDVDSMTLTSAGGTGSAPVYNFRAIGGVPGATPNVTTAPSTTPIDLQNKRNANGYARFAIVGDLDESSVDLTTDGNWEGTLTISLNGL